MTSKRRIVLLTDCLADLAGGAEKQIHELAKGLDKTKFEVFVVSLDCWGQAPRQVIESTGSQLQIFRVKRVYGISGLRQGLRFFHFLRDNRIDALVTYHFSSDLWGTAWARLAGVKTIISNRRDMGFWRRVPHILAYRMINRFVDTIVVVSQSIKAMVIKEEGFDAQRIKVIYNGVHNSAGTSPGDRATLLGVKPDDVVLMHVANLKPIKGHEFLLRALPTIVRNNPRVKLFLVGKDASDGKLQRLVQELNISDQVKFLGKRDDVGALVLAADICLLPSLSEGMSNAILEYMAAGKPTIATRVGGTPELIRDGQEGLLVEKANTAELEQALRRLIDDKPRRLSMGQAALRKVKAEFSMLAMIRSYERLLDGRS